MEVDYGSLKSLIGENLFSLVSMGNKINPYVGAGIGLLGAVALIWLSFKAGKQIWQQTKKKAGEAVAGTGKEQGSAKKIQDGIDDFLDK